MCLSVCRVLAEADMNVCSYSMKTSHFKAQESLTLWHAVKHTFPPHTFHSGSGLRLYVFPPLPWTP